MHQFLMGTVEEPGDDPGDAGDQAAAEPTPARGRGKRPAWLIGGLAAETLVALAAVGIGVAAEDRDPAADAPWEYGTSTNDLVAIGNVVCGTDPDSLFCLDAATGRERFRRRLAFPTPPGIPMPAASSGETLFVVVRVVGGGDLLRAYSIDGRRLWSARVGSVTVGIPPAAPAVAGGGVAVVAGSDLVGFDATTGEERWRVPAPVGTVAPARRLSRAYADDQRFYAMQEVDGTITVLAIDAVSGGELWTWTLEGWTPGPEGVAFP